MDIHRCRFVPYQPAAINAVAFSHHKTSPANHNAVPRLAVGRANGDIEIWNPSKGVWLQEVIIRGGRDRSIDSLVWVSEPDLDLGDGHVVIGKSRLFSIGYTSTVTEWDLGKGKPKRHASGQHGDIWCIAAQPHGAGSRTTQETQHSNKLIAGTIDGELAIYAIEDDDLRFQRILVKSPTKKAQMVSITFQSRKIVIVGCSDSTIRAYDISKGHMMRKMALEPDVAGGSKDVIAWSVKCLPNGNIISGDSTGQVCIWDGKTYTQLQSIQGHKSDVLSLATSADGTAITSGGMDRRTILYKQNADAGRRWAKVWGRRYHDHDVKAMAAYEHGRMSVVVTGGPDTNLTILPLKEMGRENHRLVRGLPHQPPVASAAKARFIVSWWEREVHLWILRRTAADLQVSVDENIDINQNRRLLKTIVINGESNISSATINDEGTLLLVSTATDLKAFRIEHQTPSRASDVTLTSIEVPAGLSRLGATHVKLSPDGRWLLVIQDGTRILVARSDCSPGMAFTNLNRIQRLARLRRTIPRHISNGGLGGYSRTITHVAFSPDSKMVAVADLAGYVDTWVLRDSQQTLLNGRSADDAASSASDSEESRSEDDDESGARSDMRWIRNPGAKLLPKLPTSPTILSFSDSLPEMGLSREVDGSDDYVLVAITSSWNILAFQPRSGTLTPWSRRHPRKSLPGPIQDLLDLPKGVIWQGSRLWVYGVSFLLMLDLAQDLAKPIEACASSFQHTKRKRVGANTGAGGKMQREQLAPHQVRKRGVHDQWEVVDLVDRPRVDSSESDDDMCDAPEDHPEPPSMPTHTDTVTPTTDIIANGPKGWWITHKYRPILGIVPFKSAGEDAEVAIVERPTWDIGMAERYFQEEEWER